MEEYQKRWSEIQSAIYSLFEPDLDLQIHRIIHQADSQGEDTEFSRYWVTLNQEIIWDYPKDFVKDGIQLENYPYASETSYISNTIKEYVNAPFNEIFGVTDMFGFCDILKAADRRIQIIKLIEVTLTAAAQKVLQARLEVREERRIYGS